MKRIVIVCSAIGFLIAAVVGALLLVHVDLAGAASRIVILWPSAVSLMAADGLGKTGQLLLLLALTVHNAVLYGLIGLTVAWARLLIRRPWKHAKTSFGVTTVATGAAAAGFVVAFGLGVLANYTSVIPAAAYQFLAPFNLQAGPHEALTRVAEVVPIALFRAPANAAIYFAAGLLVGTIWRFIRRSGPAEGSSSILMS